MALSPEQQSQLDELNRLASEPDATDEDFEIEIYSSDGSGARLPYHKGKAWLQKTFGIDIGDAPKEPPQSKKDAPKDGDGKEGGNEPQLKLFRQRQSQGSKSA